MLLASSINVEPGETVLLGALTTNNPGPPRELAINGTPIVMLRDKRLPANRRKPNGGPIFYNQYSFPMKIETAVLASAQTPPLSSSAEGYYGNVDGDDTKKVFYAYLFEYGGTGQLLVDPKTTPQISIERAPQFRDRGTSMEVEARGTLTTHHVIGPAPVQQLKFTATDENGISFDLPGGLDIRFDQREQGFIRWRLRDQYAKVGDLGREPIKLRVENISASAFLGTNVTDEYDAEFRAP